VWSGAALLLRARANGARLLVAQLVYTTGRVVAVGVLVGVAGLRGAGWGLVIGSGFAAFAFWGQVVLGSARERGGPRETVPPTSPKVLQLLTSTGRSDR